MRLSNPLGAKELAEEARSQSIRIEYKFGQGCALRTLAAASVEQSVSNAFALAVHAIEIFVSIGKVEQTASALMPVFCYYLQNSQFDRARTTLDEALVVASNFDDKNALSLIYFNFGWLARKEGDPAQAKKFFGKSLELGRNGVNDWTYWKSRARLAELLSESGRESEWRDDIELLLLDVGDVDDELAITDALCVQLEGFARAGRRAETVTAIRRARQRTRDTQNENCRARLLLAQANAMLFLGEESKYILKLRQTTTALEAANLQVRLCSILLILALAEQKAGLYELSTQHLVQHIDLKRHIQSSDAEYRLSEVLHEALTKHLMGQVVSAISKSDQLSEMNNKLQTSLDQQALLQRELMRIASTDELTGAVNRRQIVNDGILEMERYRHTGSPFSVTIIDIDHFKSINDSFGHSTGDEVLRRLTKCCQSLLRRFDVFGRLGGEEFCIIHHDTNMQGAQMAAQRIMRAVEMMFMADILPDREFSISMGVAEVHDCDNSFYDVLHMADAALYEAKRSGRNTFRIASSRTLEAA
jgi:diguanylate cyclase (GGDEF)-like protein